MGISPNDLGALMEIDHVIQVHADGRVTDAPPGIYAPEVYDGEVQPGWTLMNGYSGQHGYAGPIMHPSETIRGKLAEDILAEPGIYVAVVSTVLDGLEECDDCADMDEGGPCDSHDVDGWAVARKL